MIPDLIPDESLQIPMNSNEPRGFPKMVMDADYQWALVTPTPSPKFKLDPGSQRDLTMYPLPKKNQGLIQGQSDIG